MRWEREIPAAPVLVFDSEFHANFQIARTVLATG